MKEVIIKTIKELILPELRALEARIEDLRKDVSALNYKFDGLSAKVDGFALRLDGIDHKIDGIHLTLEGNKAHNEAIKYLLDELRRKNGSDPSIN